MFEFNECGTNELEKYTLEADHYTQNLYLLLVTKDTTTNYILFQLQRHMLLTQIFSQKYFRSSPSSVTHNQQWGYVALHHTAAVQWCPVVRVSLSPRICRESPQFSSHKQ